MNNLITKDYGGRQIHIDPVTQLVCVTELCLANGKRFQDWYRQKDTPEFLDVLSVETGIPVSTLLIVGKGRTKSWANPQVAIAIAHWCCVRARVWMTKVILDLITTGKVELNPVPMPLAVIATDDIERMQKAGHSAASRGYPEVKIRPSELPADYLPVSKVLSNALGDGINAAKESGAVRWCCHSTANTYRSNTAQEPIKANGTFHYPPSYFDLIHSHYLSFAETHSKVLASIEKRLATQPKQCEVIPFDDF
jgi:KilA-N domain